MNMAQSVSQHMKFAFDVCFMSALYLGGVLALNTDVTYIVASVGASIAGAAALAYFRRDRDYKEIFYKTATASICGLVSGSMLMEYMKVESTAYMVGTYFFSSLLSLFFIRGLLNVTEQNASQLIVSVFQRLTTTQLPNKVVPDRTDDTERPDKSKQQE